MKYKEFSSHMKQLNNEQKAIVDDILNQKPYKTISYFSSKWCKGRENFHPHVYYTKHVTILYKQITNVDPLKPKIMKLAYIRKTRFNIKGTTIHYTLAILLNKNLT
jgi:hypothetical protein